MVKLLGVITVAIVFLAILSIGAIVGNWIDKDKDKLKMQLDNQTSQYKVCINQKSTLQATKDSINQQNINKANTITILNQELKAIKRNQSNQTQTTCKQVSTITPVNNTCNNTYILGLIKQIKRLEQIAEDCTFYNQTEREIELEEDLDECNAKIKEAKEELE